MKKIAVILVFLFALSAAIGNAEAVLIDYDGTGFGTISSQIFPDILNYYSFLPGHPIHSPGFQWIDFEGFQSPIYGPHSLTAMAFSQFITPVSVQWDTEITNVNFWYGRQLDHLLSVQGYHNGNLVFDSLQLSQTTNGMLQYTLPDGTVIDQLVFTGDPNFWSMDDLSWDIYNPPGQPTIPEPASMMLLGSGLMGLVNLRKRKNSNLNADIERCGDK